MADLRIVDKRALSQASKRAREVDVPLVLLFVINPQDYAAYDRGPRRIDFVLRNLKSIKAGANERVFAPLRSYPGSSHNGIYANIEYEVDKLRRDIKILELAKQEDIKCTLVHDKLLVEPGTLSTQQAKPFSELPDEVKVPRPRDAGAVLAREIEGFTVRRCKPPGE
ncbi:DNA photolyase [Thelephora terrestris]|uniref:DNA photolyase n=1 Tax=Thelephora terrestris TaxID=56493 RepID=A0A9P6L5F1_9AGAM|nr:DNA photolyase [Thelephora terrestris]